MSANPTVSARIIGPEEEVNVSTTIRVREVLSEAQIRSNKRFVSVGEQVQFQVSTNVKSEVTVIAKFSDVLSTRSSSDSADGVETKLVKLQGSGAFNYTFKTARMVTVTITVFNDVSNLTTTYSHTIHIQESLNYLTLDAPGSVSLPEGNYVMVISSSKTYYNITCEIGIGGIVETFQYAQISPGDSIKVIFNVSSLNSVTHEGYVIFRDGLSHIKRHWTVAVINSISNFDVILNNDVVNVGDTMTVELMVSGGSNLSFVVSFGDRTLDVEYSGTETRKVFTHNYTAPAKYQIRASVVNLMFSQTITKFISVVPKLDKMLFRHQSLDKHRAKTYEGVGPQKNKYNFDNTLVIHSTAPPATNFNYTYKLDDIVLQPLSPNHRVEIIPSSLGEITYECYVTNGIDEHTEFVTVEFVLPVGRKNKIYNDGPKYKNSNITISVAIPYPTNTTCIHLTSTQKTILYGSPICETIADNHGIKSSTYDFIAGIVTELVQFEEYYDSEGSYPVTATIMNYVSRKLHRTDVSTCSVLEHAIYMGV